jgi:hypothetical protein
LSRAQISTQSLAIDRTSFENNEVGAVQDLSGPEHIKDPM